MDTLGTSFFQDPQTGSGLLQQSTHSPVRRSFDAALAGGPTQDDRHSADPALLKIMLKSKCFEARNQSASVRDNIRAAWADRGMSGQQLQGAEGIWDPVQMGLDADDRDRDVPLSGTASPNPLTMHALSSSPQMEAAIGSWSGTAGCNPTSLDAELPDFRGKPVRTGSNLASMAAAAQSMSRTGSFTNSMPAVCGAGSAAVAAAAMAVSGGVLSREGSFSADSFFNACNSAPITPRSPMTPLFDLSAGAGAASSQLDAVSSGFGKDGPGSGLGQRGSGYSGLQSEPRQHKPSKLRISSSEYDVGTNSDYGMGAAGSAQQVASVAAAVQQAAAAVAAAAGLDAYHASHGMDSSTPNLGSSSGSPEPGCLPTGVAHEARLQMQQAAMQQVAMHQAASAALSGQQGTPGGAAFSASHPFVPSQAHMAHSQAGLSGAPHAHAAQGASMAQAAMAAAASMAAQMPTHQMGPTASSSLPMLQAQQHVAQQMQQQQMQQMQQAFMMGMAAQYAQAAQAQPQAGMPGSWPQFPMPSGGFPGWQPGAMPGFGMPGMPGMPSGPDGSGMPGCFPPMPGMPGFGMPGFPPVTPECFAMWQGIWQQMQAACMNMNGPINTMAIAAAAAAAAAAATASNTEEKDATAGRGRDGSAGSLDRVRTDRTARGRDRTPGSRGGRSDDVPRSTNPLLEEFKSSKARKIEMKEVLGNMLDFSLDQHGSRFIQLKLDTLSPEDLAAAFRELAPKAMVLMNDVFGNYVIQKVLELGPEDHREELAQQMKGQVLNLSLQMYSCRVVQRALEVLPLERRIALVRELQDHAMRCVRDQNGNHVIQKCIECVPSEQLTTMLDTFNGQIVSLSMHSFGCRVVQRVLEHCGGTPRYDSVMAEVQTAIVQLAQDQYGNYVIQHILEFGRPGERDRVIDALAPHIVTLSQNKFASNVVEKCLLHGKPGQREALVEAILAQPQGLGSGEGGLGAGVCDSPLHQMMRDQFGNYVVQKLLEVCNEDQRERLLEQLRVQLPYLKRLTYGKHIVARVEKLLCSGARISTGALAAAAAAAASTSVAPMQASSGSGSPTGTYDGSAAMQAGGKPGSNSPGGGAGSPAADELAANVSGLDIGTSLNTEALVAAAAAANTADERQW